MARWYADGRIRVGQVQKDTAKLLQVLLHLAPGAQGQGIGVPRGRR